jgi:hypothetical protein
VQGDSVFTRHQAVLLHCSIHPILRVKNFWLEHNGCQNGYSLMLMQTHMAKQQSSVFAQTENSA